MQGHRAIEIGLGRPHPHSDCSHLDNFSRMLANHVTSEHLPAAHSKTSFNKQRGPCLGKA